MNWPDLLSTYVSASFPHGPFSSDGPSAYRSFFPRVCLSYSNPIASISIMNPNKFNGATLQLFKGAHACSEIGLKWFLFAFHDLRKVLGFVAVLDFFEHLSSWAPAEMCKTELWPFLTILGTRMRVTAIRGDSRKLLEGWRTNSESLRNRKGLQAITEQVRAGSRLTSQSRVWG
jgi:hypothetical protein